MVLTKNSAEFRRELFNSLDACTLRHSPPQLNRGIIPAFTTLVDDVAYEMVEPELFGDLDALNRLFEADGDITDDSPFDHSCIAPEVQDPIGRHFPLHAECGSPGFERIPKGLIRGEREAEYLLVARDGDDVPVGYVEFTIGISYCEEAEPEEVILEGDDGELSCIWLYVKIEQFYVRKAYRRKGAATAMATCLVHVFEKELTALGKSCSHVAERLETKIAIETELGTDYDSRSMVLVHSLVYFWMNGAVEEAIEDNESEYLVFEKLGSDSGY